MAAEQLTASWRSVIVTQGFRGRGISKPWGSDFLWLRGVKLLVKGLQALVSCTPTSGVKRWRSGSLSALLLLWGDVAQPLWDQGPRPGNKGSDPKACSQSSSSPARKVEKHRAPHDAARSRQMIA